jgi:hypothetical protein
MLSTNNSVEDKMVKHIVMWNIQDGLNKDETIMTLKLKLEGLTAEIDFLNKVELGTGFNDSATRRDVVLYTEFGTIQDLANYLVHPAHKKVGEYVRSVVCDRIDVDYEV